MSGPTTIRILIVDDNPLVRGLIAEGLSALGEVFPAADGADALLKAIDDPPDLIITDYRMPGLDGRQLFEKLRGREQTRNIPFLFLASRGDIEEKLRPLVEGAEDFIPKPFFIKDLLGRVKKVVDRLRLEKLQNKAARPGVIEGRLEELSIADLMQSLEMGQKSCRLTVRRGSEQCEMFFSAGQCKHARRGDVEGEEAVFPVVHWTEGEFEIDFTGNSDQTTITRSTAALLMESMKLLDEANSQVESS
jgi:DNA-binding response OmpR family regulator